MFSGVADQRFSLRMLDPNEYSFDDYSVEYYPKGILNSEDSDFKSIQGTLKVCSKSILFVPSNGCDAIIRIKQQDISCVKHYEPLDLSYLKTKKVEGDLFTVESTCHYQIQNCVSAIIPKRSSTILHFSLVYVPGDKVIPFLQQLNRASQLPHVEHQTMIAMIAHHRQSLYPFKSMFFDDLYERECGNFVVDMVEPLVNVPGRIVVSKARFYFQPFSNAFSMADIVKWKLESIVQVIPRSYVLQDVGLEVYIIENGVTSNYLFVLDSVESRNKLHEFLVANCQKTLEDSQQSNMTLKWQNGVISNYEYLYYLNNMADRTVNNLSQYPVFPWVFSDYTSTSIDICDPAIYRDLSRPIGGLNKKRLDRILERYYDMPEPRFMYGSHYSTPGFITYYLTRSKPDLMLCLMGGKFDHPDRLFAGIAETWNNVLNNSADFKELIPEFYQGDGAFLENRKKLDLGKRQNGSVVGDVELPPWAESPTDFIQKMSAGLESEYVSANLHHWIDLIFGYKQKGPLAEQNHNIFHPYCYPGTVDINTILDPNEKNCVVTQILEFGQVPQQIFKKPHPEKKLAIYPSLEVNTVESDLEYQDTEDTPSPSISSSSISLSSFSFSSKIPTKNHVTFFIECSDTSTVYVGTASGMMYTYRLPDMKYAYGVIISNVSLICGVDLKHSLCVGSSDGKCYVLSKQQGSVYQSIPCHYDTITDMQLDADLIFSSSWDSSVKVWSVTTTPQNKIKGLRLINDLDHDDVVQSIAVSGPMLVSCVQGCSVVVWDWDAMEVLHTIDYTHHDIAHAAIWDNHVVLMGVSVVYLNFKTFEEGLTRRFDANIRSYQICGNILCTLEQNGKITLFDLVEGRLVEELETSQEDSTCLHLREKLLLIGNSSRGFAVFNSTSS